VSRQLLTNRWSAGDFERSYAPGKWTARQILIHLAQTELALGNRARMALTIPNYAAQKFDQDQWVEREGSLDARTAVEALLALMTMASTKPRSGEVGHISDTGSRHRACRSVSEFVRESWLGNRSA
jgi:hypothetical protein